MQSACNIILINLLIAFIFQTASAGVVIGGTRLIYHEGKKEESLTVTNHDNTSYLVQSWIETESGSKSAAEFIITPPLYRADAQQDNTLRVIRIAGQLPADRESLFWLNVKAIPGTEKNDSANRLVIATKTRIKLLYRPAILHSTSPQQMAAKLRWQQRAKQLTVHNPTPYYMNFSRVSIAGREINEATYVAPLSSASYSLKENISGSVSWQIINDYGGTGESHSAAVSR